MSASRTISYVKLGCVSMCYWGVHYEDGVLVGLRSMIRKFWQNINMIEKQVITRQSLIPSYDNEKHFWIATKRHNTKANTGGQFQRKMGKTAPCIWHWFICYCSMQVLVKHCDYSCRDFTRPGLIYVDICCTKVQMSELGHARLNQAKSTKTIEWIMISTMYVCKLKFLLRYEYKKLKS